MRKTLSRIHFVLIASFVSIGSVFASAMPDLVPLPKIYQQKGKAVNIEKIPIHIQQGNRQCEIAAKEITLRIKELGGAPGETVPGIQTDQNGIFILTVADNAAEILKKQYELDVTATYPGPQGYVIHADSDKIIIIGSDNIGALYGAMTLRQMIIKKNSILQLPGALVRDWPDFKRRTGISFSRGLDKLSYGEKDQMAAIKAGIDWMTRFKMNIIDDYSTLDPRVTPESIKQLWKKVNQYATERGIGTMHGLWSNLYGYTSSRKNLEILPPGIKKKEDWPCVYEARSYREAYYCWSDDDAAKEVIETEADLLRECGFTMFFLHPVDGGGLDDPEFWSKRCQRCRDRWKDNERWKATIHQYSLWNRILKEKNPELTIMAPLYPYSATYLGLKTPENAKIWKQNVVDYWLHINKGLDPDIYFNIWFSGDREHLDQYRSILMGRPIAFDDCHTQQMGVFSTQCRFFITDFNSMLDMMKTVGVNKTQSNWVFMFNAAEYAWNTTSPGCAEFKEGMIYYDFEKDHTGPATIIKEWLPKVCRIFWGEKIAGEMAAFYGSGILPRYILDPGASISIMNKFRSDPLADTDPLAKKKVSKKAGPTLVVDDTARMKVQAEAAKVCFDSLRKAFENSRDLDKYKKKLLVKHYRRSVFWLTIAQARYDIRTGNDLMKQGKNSEALEAYRQGFEQYEKNKKQAVDIANMLKSIPDIERFVEPKIAKDLSEKFKVKIESAETVVKPRQIGEFVKIAIYDGKGVKGTKEFFDQFKNVEAKVIDNLSLKTLNDFDCLFMLLDESVDRFDYFQNLKTYVEQGGGGVVFEHSLCGHKRFDVKTPFPDVCVNSPNRCDNFDRRIFATQNPVFRNIKSGTEYQNMYRDFFSPVPGKNGFVIAVDKDKQPVAVAGKAGLGKVVFDGCLSRSCVNNTWASEDKTLYGFNAILAEKAVEWFTGVKLEHK